MRFFFILVLSLSNSWLLGQENTINLSIKISDDSTGLGLEGATVKILQDMKTYASRKTDSSGRVSFEGLPIQHVYWISLEKEGFVTKCISMNAHSDFPEDLPMLYKQPMETGLFRPLPHEDFAFLKEEPMVKFSFDQAGILTWDKRSLMEMQKK